MPVLNPQYDIPALKARLQQHEGLVIACYCAAWCDTCASYLPEFEALAERWPGHVFVWIDIEENPEFLGDDDVENFPTLLVQNRLGNAFFGPLQPFISHLERLLSRIDASTAATQGGPPLLSSLLTGSA